MESGISIIIPHFNRSEIIRETLSSIDDQTCDNWEVIVVDDQSEDSEYKRLKSYESDFSRLSVFQRPDELTKGANACRNIGINNSRYDWVMFLDSDDLISNTCVETRLDNIKNDDDMVVFNMQRFSKTPGDSSTIVNKHHHIHTADQLLDNFLLFKLPWPITSVLWRKDFLKKIMFDENLIRFQDVEIHIRALLRKPRLNLYPVHEPDCFYRNSDYDFTLTKKKAINTIDAGFYMINKIIPHLSEDQKNKLLGFLYFLAKTFSPGIDLSFQKQFYTIYDKLSGDVNSYNGKLLIFLSNRYISKIPGINYLKQRCFFYGRKRL